ncbi:adenylyl/guanylyl cyclase [Fragilaria crotonensis]|nr:adenylyl/guanylyl cyclase [Fragilaria crotonensis]
MGPKMFKENEMTSALPHNLIGNSFLPDHYQPSALDVICARGIKSFYHSGNLDFRKSIADNLEKYGAASDKRDKSMIVSAITNKLYFNEESPRKFIRFCDSTKLWYEISYDQVRQKVGQTIRDALVHQNPQRRLRKKHRRARRASTIRRCVPRNANSRVSQSFATTTTHSDEQIVNAERDHGTVSENPHATCLQCRFSILSKGHSPHYEAFLPSIHVLKNANSQGEQLCHDLSLANLEWAASVGKALKAANVPYSIDCGHDALDSDTTSVSSCHWFQDCDEMSLTSCDWMESYDGNFWI